MTTWQPAAEGRKQRGFTLIETLLAIAIGAAMMVAAAYALQQRSAEIRDKAMAEQLRIVTDATERFIRDNHLRIQDEAPRRYTMADLASYLPQGFGARTAFGETFVLVSRPLVKGGAPNGAEVMIVSGNGAGAIDDLDQKRIPVIAGLAGARAGFFANKVPAAAGCGQAVCGAFGGYATDLAGFAGHGLTSPTFASLLYMDKLTVTADYLYRTQVPGHPELNEMFTNEIAGKPRPSGRGGTAA